MEQHGESQRRRAQEVLIPEDPAEIEPKQTLDTGTPPIQFISASVDLPQWLAKGWKDLLNSPQALVHGLVVSAVGLLILAYSWGQPVLSMVFISGFLLVGPVLAVGVNEMARRLEKGDSKPVGLGLGALSDLGGALWIYAAVLIILFALWATVVWRWIALMTLGDLGVPGTMGEVLRVMLESPKGVASLVGVIAAGAVFAIAVFALSVVTLPAMLDRQRGFVDAVAVSFKAFRDNPGPLLVWGLIITALFAISVATAFIALIVIFPWLGFAMWHGYRTLVVSDVRGRRQKEHAIHG
jgi:uncharacterized membrane protein